MFSKEKFCKDFDFKFAIPKVYGGGEIIMNLRVALAEESVLIKQRFFGLEGDDKTRELTKTIRALVCSLLVSEPNIEDFPRDSRPLGERALEYFTVEDAELQSFFDSILLGAFLAHKNLTEVETEDFFLRSK